MEIKRILLLLSIGIGFSFGAEMLTSPDSVATFLKGQRGWIVAKEGGNKITVILLPELLSYTLIEEASNVYNLAISPDGSRVLYESGNNLVIHEIGQGNTQRYLLSKGFYQTWWIDPVSQQEYIIYTDTNHQEVLSPEKLYPGKTYKQNIRNNKAVGPPEVIYSQGFKCGLSKNGRWLGTGVFTSMLYDMQEGKLIRLTPAPGSTQACWAVMNPTKDTARMDEISFFNNIHSQIVTKNRFDKVVWQMPTSAAKSQGLEKWHSGKWSNREDWMCMGAQYADGIRLGLIRRSTKEFLLLAKATPISGKTKTDLFHQDMWLTGEEPVVSGMRKIKVNEKTKLEPILMVPVDGRVGKMIGENVVKIIETKF